MKYTKSQIVFVGLVLFLIYAGFHPEKMAPDFFARIIPLGALHILSCFAGVLLVFAFVFAAVNMAKYVKSGEAANDKRTNSFKNFPIKTFTCAIGSLALVLVLSDLARTGARNGLKRYLGNVSGDVAVKVNGEFVANPNEIVDKLRKVAPLPAHHSRTTKKICLEILSNDNVLTVRLERDADIPEEYWVFYPRYRWRLYDEIGRITTNLFDDY